MNFFDAHDAQIVVGLLIAMAILEIWNINKAWRKKQIVFELKRIGNSLSYMIAFILSIYILIGALAIIPAVKEWSLSHYNANGSALGGWFIRYGTTYAVIISAILLIVWLQLKSIRLFKFNDKEKEWDKEQRIKFNNKLPKYLKFLSYKVEK